jgi:hypothetical protein
MWIISAVLVEWQQMIKDVTVKLNLGLPWQKQHSARTKIFRRQIILKF